MGLIEVQWGGVDWMHVPRNIHQWRHHVNTIILTHWIPQKTGKLSAVSETTKALQSGLFAMELIVP
jgi:hypothetical protein